MKNKALLILLVLSIGFACKEEFSPEVDAQYKNILVVEGYLNIGGSSSFLLSRTGDLKDQLTRIPEAASRMDIEDEQGTVIQGISEENGRCLLNTSNLDINKKYRVKITTKDGKTYQTSFLESKITPGIDSISRRVENEGFNLYVSSHDNSNKTRFYSWDYEETWEVSSPYLSFLEYRNGQIINRDQNINISRCWQINTSSEILLGSTERLSEDKITLVPLTFVRGNSIKLDQLYSILVRQYSHTLEGYQYLENMKKNTEKIGTIFDPQPSELKGNLTCLTDSKEQVIGWIGAGTVTEARIFIHRRDRLLGWSYRGESCISQDVPIDSVTFYTMGGYLIRDYVPFDPMLGPPTEIDMARARCIDCRLMGTNVKPTYWPN